MLGLMRGRTALVLLATTLALPALSLQPAHARARSRLPPPQTVEPSAIRVHDGDTFSVGLLKIRLRGVDTPELGAPGGRLAAQRLAALLREGPVTIVPRAEDAYGRIVADVFVGGRDVARVLRREGFDKFGRRG